jgi:L-fuconolactonase
MNQCIDAHHHFWRYRAEEFGWIDDGMQPLRRDFLPDDLLALLPAAGVDGTVVVQALQTVTETEWLLAMARATPQICGVVGWVPLCEADTDAHLQRLAAEPLLKGVRHVVQAECDGFLANPRFNAGVSLLKEYGLVYDMLIFDRQLAEAICFVDRHPNQSFVLDHLAKPRIAAGEIDLWRRNICALAQRPHVSCKLSGMVTEADPKKWTPKQLDPYVDAVLEAFGSERLMIGTDWPVLTVGCDYARWWELARSWIAPLSESEQSAILGMTAQRVYGLSVPQVEANAATHLHQTQGAH